MSISSKTSHLNVVLRLGNIMGMMPLKAENRAFKAYVIVLLSLSLMGYIYSEKGKLSFNTDAPNYYIIRLMIQVNDFLLFVTSLTASISCVFLFPQIIRNTFFVLSKVGRKLHVPPEKTKKMFWYVVILTNSLMLCSIGLLFWAWSNKKGSFTSKYHALKSIHQYQKEITLLVWYWLVTDIRLKFEVLNRYLLRITIDSEESREASHVRLRVEYFCNTTRKLKSLSNFHNILCDSVDGVNKIFGLVLFLHVIADVVNIIQATCTLIFFTIMNSEVNGISHGTDFYTSYCFLLLYLFIKLLAVAAVGDFMTKEANGTIRICYNVLGTLQFKQESVLLKRELELFARQVMYRKPSISAAGFFTVDFTMMGFLVSSVTSYIIVAIQFLKAD